LIANTFSIVVWKDMFSADIKFYLRETIFIAIVVSRRSVLFYFYSFVCVVVLYSRKLDKHRPKIIYEHRRGRDVGVRGQKSETVCGSQKRIRSSFCDRQATPLLSCMSNGRTSHHLSINTGMIFACIWYFRKNKNRQTSKR